MKLIGLLSFGLLLFFVMPLEARIVVQQKGRVQLQYDDISKIALSDTVRIDLVVDGTPELVVDMPKEMPEGAKWSLVERWPEYKEKISAHRVSWSVRCFFAPREPGQKVELVFPPIKIKEGKQEETIAFAPVFFEVATRIQDPNVKDLRDITAIERLPPLEPVNRDWIWWLASSVATVFAIALAFLVRRILFKTPVLTSEQIALHELVRLDNLHLPEQGKSERFITLLTTLVRRYLERQFALPVRRQTTPEFVGQLGSVAALNAEEKQFLSTFLQRCEAVKFANAGMSSDECRKWSEQARQFFERRVKVR